MEGSHIWDKMSRTATAASEALATVDPATLVGGPDEPASPQQLSNNAPALNRDFYPSWYGGPPVTSPPRYASEADILLFLTDDLLPSVESKKVRAQNN